MEPRGRGRGVGRARGGQNVQGGGGQQRPPQRPGPPQQQRPQEQPQQGAGTLRGTGTQFVRPAQPAAWPRPQGGGAPQPAAPPTQQPIQMAGRGASRADEPGPGAGGTGHTIGQGDSEGNQARGGSSSVRGRVVARELVVTRPPSITSKTGTTGKPVNLTANFFPLNHSGKWCLFQYRVDIAPEVDHTQKRKYLVRVATKEVLKGGYLFDGTVLYTPQRINPDPCELFAQDDRTNENYRVTIRLVGDLTWGDFHYLQVFNIIVRKCLHLMGMQLIGRDYFLPNQSISIGEHGIELWPGYTTSMRQHEREILLNVDVKFKMLRNDNVYQMLLECVGANAKKDFQTKVIGCIVLTTYNNKTYRIDDVDFASTPMSSFKKRDESEITYKAYFESKYNVRITVPNQPMLVSRSKPREIRSGMPETVYLVPELCKMTGLTDKQRENFHLMKALANHTRVGADGRIRKLMDFSRQIQSRPECVAEIRRWDLGIAQSLVTVKGRELPPEIIYGGGGDANKFHGGDQADWTKELRSRPMFFSPKAERIACVVPGRFKGPAAEFMGLIKKAADGMRWDCGLPRIFDIPDDRTGTYLETIEKLINTSQPSLIIVVLSTNSQDRYNAIKKKCCVDRAMPTQMIVSRTLNNKGAMSIATKVAIQMNCKVGGAPWAVGMPLSHLMVVGYDVCRDTVNKKKSFAGIVASLDKNLTRYFSAAYEHQNEEEISENFAAFMILACQKYKQTNNVYPDRIAIYRDGVGEGQIPYVQDHEVANIKRVLKEQIYKEQELKFQFTIVSKRHNTRIFLGDRNPKPGTVVDDVITQPERYDFFLVPQCVRQGTVAPTSFNVIDDNIGLPPDRTQILAYKMCHMYYNWSGTVRVPAPCQYAHKLAFLVSQALHRPAHQDLDSQLYFL